MLLFYIRHGDPIYSPDSLTELGEEQARALVSRMERCRPDKIFASVLHRAYLTAKPTADRSGMGIERLGFLDETQAYLDMKCTDSTGRTGWAFCLREYQELFVTPEVRKMGRNWYQHPYFADHPTFGTCMRRVQEGTDAFLLKLGYRHDHERCAFIAERPNDDRIAVFAHQGVGLLFLAALLDIPYPQMCTHFDMAHTGMTVIHFEGNGIVIPRVLQLSNDSHLFAQGLPTKYQNQIEF
ncbi:MAG: histidine phosphatase family protein [Clostridia bacterium]|nr:histidine phosphatase family protein [Clostridia bacterium]